MNRARYLTKFIAFILVSIFVFGVASASSNTIKVTGGANQKSQLKGDSPKGGQARFGAITVQILKGSKPVKGAKVYFDCVKPRGVACEFGMKRTHVGTSNAKGIVRTPGFRVYYGSGKMSFKVSTKGAKNVSVPFTVQKKHHLPKPLLEQR